MTLTIEEAQEIAEHYIGGVIDVTELPERPAGAKPVPMLGPVKSDVSNAFAMQGVYVVRSAGDRLHLVGLRHVVDYQGRLELDAHGKAVLLPLIAPVPAGHWLEREHHAGGDSA